MSDYGALPGGVENIDYFSTTESDTLPKWINRDNQLYTDNRSNTYKEEMVNIDDVLKYNANAPAGRKTKRTPKWLQETINKSINIYKKNIYKEKYSYSSSINKNFINEVYEALKGSYKLSSENGGKRAWKWKDRITALEEVYKKYRKKISDSDKAYVSILLDNVASRREFKKYEGGINAVKKNYISNNIVSKNSSLPSANYSSSRRESDKKRKKSFFQRLKDMYKRKKKSFARNLAALAAGTLVLLHPTTHDNALSYVNRYPSYFPPRIELKFEEIIPHYELSHHFLTMDEILEMYSEVASSSESEVSPQEKKDLKYDSTWWIKALEKMGYRLKGRRRIDIGKYLRVIRLRSECGMGANVDKIEKELKNNGLSPTRYIPIIVHRNTQDYSRIGVCIKDMKTGQEYVLEELIEYGNGKYKIITHPGVYDEIKEVDPAHATWNDL